MDSVVLLSVLVIVQTIVSARPTDMDLKTKRSIDDSSELFYTESINFPTDVRHGFTVTINGTIDIKNPFEVAFPAANEEEEDCRIIYDINSKTLDVLPAPPQENNKMKYEIFSKDGENPTFSIKLRARSMNQNNMFKLSFEANGGGESPLVTCPIKSFDNFKKIEFRNGVHSITSFLFEFS